MPEGTNIARFCGRCSTWPSLSTLSDIKIYIQALPDGSFESGQNDHAETEHSALHYPNLHIYDAVFQLSSCMSTMYLGTSWIWEQSTGRIMVADATCEIQAILASSTDRIKGTRIHCTAWCDTEAHGRTNGQWTSLYLHLLSSISKIYLHPMDPAPAV
jgi:hypothetical protein